MRLMREFDSVEEKLETGKLSLTAVGELQMTIVRKEHPLRLLPYASVNPILGIKEDGKKLSREVKASLLKKIEERLKVADFKLKTETVKKLKKLGDKLEVQDLDLLVQMLVKEKEERVIEEKQTTKVAPSLKGSSVKEKTTKQVPLKIRRRLFIRSNYQCENRVNGVRCTSKKYLNVDHIWPQSLRGKQYGIETG